MISALVDMYFTWAAFEAGRYYEDKWSHYKAYTGLLQTLGVIGVTLLSGVLAPPAHILDLLIQLWRVVIGWVDGQIQIKFWFCYLFNRKRLMWGGKVLYYANENMVKTDTWQHRILTKTVKLTSIINGYDHDKYSAWRANNLYRLTANYEWADEDEMYNYFKLS